MRFQLFIFGLCIVAIGCNADPRCRRETALLRAEILDLEDKYYLTKAQRDDALAVLEGRGDTVAAAKIAKKGPLNQSPSRREVIYGDVIYDGSVDDSVIYDDGVIYDSTGRSSVAPPYDYAPYDYSATDVDGRSLPAAKTLQTAPSRSADKFQLELDSPEIIEPLEFNSPLPTNDGLPDPTRPQTVPVNPASSILLNKSPAESAKRLSADTVTEIVIDHDRTRGHDGDGQPGDEGISLLLKPKTASGETVLQAGHLTVSVIDPTATSASQRIGIWKFVPAEAELFFSDESPASRGILLNLPWEQSVPRGKKVVVFVRFQTSDGRRLETKADIRINPPVAAPTNKRKSDELIADWTDRLEQPVPPSPTENRKTVPAVSVSSGPERITKPNWRPVR